MISNCNFEDLDSGIIDSGQPVEFTDWTFYSANDSAYVQQVSDSPSPGSASAKMIVRDATDSIRQWVMMSPSTQYRLDGYYKTSDGNEASVTLSDGLGWSETYRLAPAIEWRRYEVIFTTPETIGGSGIRLSLAAWPAELWSPVYYNDAHMHEVVYRTGGRH